MQELYSALATEAVVSPPDPLLARKKSKAFFFLFDFFNASRGSGHETTEAVAKRGAFSEIKAKLYSDNTNQGQVILQ